MAGFTGTSSCVKHTIFLQLIDGIFWRDIFPTFDDEKIKIRAEQTYQEWVKRLVHPFFELSTFFICQNATQKLGKSIELLRFE